MAVIFRQILRAQSRSLIPSPAMGGARSGRASHRTRQQVDRSGIVEPRRPCDDRPRGPPSRCRSEGAYTRTVSPPGSHAGSRDANRSELRRATPIGRKSGHDIATPRRPAATVDLRSLAHEAGGQRPISPRSPDDRRRESVGPRSLGPSGGSSCRLARNAGAVAAPVALGRCRLSPRAVRARWDTREPRLRAARPRLLRLPSGQTCSRSSRRDAATGFGCECLTRGGLAQPAAAHEPAVRASGTSTNLCISSSDALSGSCCARLSAKRV